MKKVYLFHLGVLIYILFMYVTQEIFSFMALNVFLAWLPIIFGQLVLVLKKNWRWVAVPIWLLFFPNIPYLLTDLFHFAGLTIYQPEGHFLNNSSEWWAYFSLLLPVLIMVFIGMSQVFKLFRCIEEITVVKKIGGFILLAVLSSLAIYVGRFERIHSIELLFQPITVFQLLVGNWSLEKSQFVLMFSILQLGIWTLIYFLQQNAQEE